MKIILLLEQARRELLNKLNINNNNIQNTSLSILFRIENSNSFFFHSQGLWKKATVEYQFRPTSPLGTKQSWLYCRYVKYVNNHLLHKLSSTLDRLDTFQRQIPVYYLSSTFLFVSLITILHCTNSVWIWRVPNHPSAWKLCIGTMHWAGFHWGHSYIFYTCIHAVVLYLVGLCVMPIFGKKKKKVLGWMEEVLVFWR
jgi:hypothetical protein